VGNQIIRKYSYAYTAVCPETGESYSLILPYANSICMNIFMNEFSDYFKNYRVIMAMDRASWHTGDKTNKWDNIVPLFIPPYSPELNPVENIWDYIRENYRFKNTTFSSLKSVEDKLEKSLLDLQKNKDVVRSITLFNWIYSAIC